VAGVPQGGAGVAGATNERLARSAPLPLVGRGWGWGSRESGNAVPERSTPLPNPPPQGERERTERVARPEQRRQSRSNYPCEMNFVLR
jgi:hypothetical protein